MRLTSISTNAVKKVPGMLVTAGFLAWSASHVAGLTWHVLAPESEVSASTVFTDVGFMPGTANGHNIDLDRLRSVFVLSAMGQSAHPYQHTDASVQAADTRLALSLKGAVLSNDASRSRAIIASADIQDVYQPGDNLHNTPGTVVLQAIHQTYVLLDNNGRIEALRMDEPELPVTAEIAEPLENKIENTIEAISGAMPAGIDSQSNFTDLVRIQPVFEPPESARAGVLRGLQIRHGSRQDFLTALGLQQGDLITAIDGKQLDNVAGLSSLMDQLSTQQAVSLNVLRDQTPLSITLDRSRW